jgi:hypothetical protein
MGFLHRIIEKYIMERLIVQGYWIIASRSGGVDFDFFSDGVPCNFRLPFELIRLTISSKDMYQS